MLTIYSINFFKIGINEELKFFQIIFNKIIIFYKIVILLSFTYFITVFIFKVFIIKLYSLINLVNQGEQRQTLGIRFAQHVQVYRKRTFQEGRNGAHMIHVIFLFFNLNARHDTQAQVLVLPPPSMLLKSKSLLEGHPQFGISRDTHIFRYNLFPD